jgi:hypothetical protein
MVVVMRTGALPEEIDAVVARVESAGGSAFVSRGVQRTIVGLVGDIAAFQSLNLRAMPGVGDYRPILEFLLNEDGLGYARKPKALIPFHAYPEGPRLAFEEHLAEAKALVRDREGVCRLHFTLSPRHEERFRKALSGALGRYESDGTRYRIGISVQDPATDTPAADKEGRPFRDSAGNLVFRSGGHGALLANLAACDGDIVFIKNIDNIVADGMRPEITEWRIVMGGLLAETQGRIFRLLRSVRDSSDARILAEAARYAEGALGTRLPNRAKEYDGEPEREWAQEYLIRLLDRPVRVCAMVENRGEPGGAPFWVRHKDGSSRLQIVEQPQVDDRDPVQSEIAKRAGFFNPTDMVCGLRDSSGRPFDLNRYVDQDSGFITEKSMEGRSLKALELPGLWNGSMADWNTLFIEAPAEIFHPVKTVTDLLRAGHVSASI